MTAPYFPRYFTPLAARAVAEAEAADLGAGPVPYTLTPAAEAAIDDKELEAGT
jgi:hypothetical protein